MSRGEELAAPYYAFKAKGYNVTIASIKGGEVGTANALIRLDSMEGCGENWSVRDRLDKGVSNTACGFRVLLRRSPWTMLR